MPFSIETQGLDDVVVKGEDAWKVRVNQTLVWPDGAPLVTVGQKKTFIGGGWQRNVTYRGYSKGVDSFLASTPFGSIDNRSFGNFNVDGVVISDFYWYINEQDAPALWVVKEGSFAVNAFEWIDIKISGAFQRYHTNNTRYYHQPEPGQNTTIWVWDLPGGSGNWPQWSVGEQVQMRVKS